MMACRELVELAGDYVEGALGPEDSARFEAHLEECPYCTEYLVQIDRVREALGGAQEPGLPDDARAKLLAAFRQRPV